jgi:hypothetical protein
MSSFDQFLSYFEVPPPQCAPTVPSADPPPRRLAFLSLLDVARSFGLRLARLLVVAYAIAFWSVALALVAGVLILGIREALR